MLLDMQSVNWRGVKKPVSKVEELIIGVGNNIDYGVKVTDKTLKECVVAMSRMENALLDLRAQSVEGSINRTIINNALGIEDGQ